MSREEKLRRDMMNMAPRSNEEYYKEQRDFAVDIAIQMATGQITEAQGLLKLARKGLITEERGE